MKGKGKCKSCHTLGLWCGNATCTRKEIWNGFIKLRYTLGNTVKVCWFQKPAGSLEMHWNESIVQFLMDDLWKQNSNVWHDAWGMTRLSRMECGFSKLPKFQWSLLKIFRLYEIKIKGEICSHPVNILAWAQVSFFFFFFSQGPNQVLRERLSSTHFPWSIWTSKKSMQLRCWMKANMGRWNSLSFFADYCGQPVSCTNSLHQRM